MPKLPECDCPCAHCPSGNRCLFCSHSHHFVCAIHPYGVEGNSCMDFRPNPELEGKQFVDFLGIGEDNGELTLQPRQRWTREQQLELLDTHPLFTGSCPQCGYEFQRDYTARVHWDCPECGWMDDTV